MVTSPGIHYGISSRDYHAWELDKSKLINGPISCSMLKSFAPNPFAWRFGPEKKTTSAMRAGSLFDYALTEPNLLEAQCHLSPYPDFKKKEAREWRDSILESGDLIVTEESLTHARNAAEKVREHPVAGPIVAAADYQVGIVSEIGGTPAKCLLDIVPKEEAWDEVLWDYKTTEGLDDESIRRTIGQWKYHWQAAFYRTMWNKASEDRYCERFGFIFQDRATLEVRVVILPQDDLDLGRRSVAAALEDFATCARRGIHSRYLKNSSELGPLPYQAMNEEEDLERKEVA